MSTLLTLCQGTNKYAAQSALIDAQMEAVNAKVKEAMAGLSDDEAKEQIKIIQAAVSNHNQLFANTPAGSLNNALINAGLTRLDYTRRHAEKNIESNGLLFIGGKVLVCDPYKVSKYYSQSMTDSSQVLPGLTSENDGSVKASRAKALVGSKSGQIDSCTGTYNANGTVDQMREIFKGMGGDLIGMKRFIHDTWVYGINVLWSMPYTEEVIKPADVDTFDFDAVRELLSFPAYDEDINIIDNVAYVYAEHYVTDACARPLAEAKARDLATSLGIKGTPSLICRLVRSADTEDVSNGCISVTTSGFDPLKLDDQSYAIGIAVNGIRRTIDVTGDKGSNAIFLDYNADIIATNISVAFGSHLKVTAYGGEIKFTVAEAGPKTSLEFFKADANDATDELGINGLLNSSISHANRTGSVASDSTLKLDNSFTAKWTGGKSKDSSVTDALAAVVKEYDLDSMKALCTVSGTSYWETIADEVQVKVEALDTACNADSSTDAWVKECRPVIRAIERLYGYTDIPDFKVREAKIIISELGDDSIIDLLNRRPKVDMIDLTFSKHEITEAITAAMNIQSDSDGVVESKVGSEVTQVNPFRQNRGKMAYACGLFNFIDERLQAADPLVIRHMKERLCAYASSLVVSTESITQKSQHSSIGKKISNFVDDLQSLCAMFGRNIGTLLIDSDAPAKVASAIIDYACRQSPETCEKVQEFFNMMNRNKRKLVNGVSDVEDAIATAIGDTLDYVIGGTLSGLIYLINLLSRLLEQATKIVEGAKASVTGFFQTVFNRPGQSLPEILSDLANLSYNVYGDFSIKTKFMSCYASGSASASVGVIFNQTFEMINGLIGAVIKKVDAIVKALTEALSVIQCIADKLMQSFQGFSSFEMAGAGVYVAAGMVPVPVSFNLQCTVSYGYEAPDPGIARALARLTAAINALGASMKLQTIKFNTLSKSALIYKGTEITQQTAAASIIEDIRAAINKKLESLLTC